MVVMVSASVTAEELVTLTDGDANVQVAPVGQPLVTLRLTVPVNPPAGVTLMVDCPGCPGAGMMTGEGFADSVKPETVIVVAGEVEAP